MWYMAVVLYACRSEELSRLVPETLQLSCCVSYQPTASGLASYIVAVSVLLRTTVSTCLTSYITWLLVAPGCCAAGTIRCWTSRKTTLQCHYRYITCRLWQHPSTPKCQNCKSQRNRKFRRPITSTSSRSNQSYHRNLPIVSDTSLFDWHRALGVSYKTRSVTQHAACSCLRRAESQETARSSFTMH